MLTDVFYKCAKAGGDSAASRVFTWLDLESSQTWGFSSLSAIPLFDFCISEPNFHFLLLWVPAELTVTHHRGFSRYYPTPSLVGPGAWALHSKIAAGLPAEKQFIVFVFLIAISIEIIPGGNCSSRLRWGTAVSHHVINLQDWLVGQTWHLSAVVAICHQVHIPLQVQTASLHTAFGPVVISMDV